MERVRKLIQCQDASVQHLTGKNVSVGVLDSGVFMHDDLKDNIEGFYDFIHNRQTTPYDDTGHGTHVCGILAGNGRASAGRYRGIAPRAKLYVGKILDQNGEGDISTLIRGLQWLLSISAKEKIRIINISISSVDFAKESEKRSLYRLFRIAFDNNILIVTAAGNAGPSGSTISRLGDSSYVICVGCHEGKHYAGNGKKCQDCSGRGPGFFVYKKPDLVAPGTEIISCSRYQGKYVAKSGTSMATPIVSGILALAVEKNPYISAQELKRRLILSADDLGESYLMQGFGMVNAKRMLQEIKSR